MREFDKEYGVVVIGGGHAGCEAALASARLGVETLLITMNLDTIALMPCNPAIGGVGKGHLVREIDALGGEMAKVIDATGLQYRVLNTSKGPAVHAYRAQADKNLYRLAMRSVLEHTPGLKLHQSTINKLIIEDNIVIGVETSLGERFGARAVIIATGTFLNGLMHFGLKTEPGGRLAEHPAVGITDSLTQAGFRLGRLKTGTNPRLDARSIDFTKMEPQYGDTPIRPFSY